MILSSIYMALHTFKVLCKHSLINLCFRDPVQQSLPQGTTSQSPGMELPEHAWCRGVEIPPAGKVQLCTSGRQGNLPCCSQGRCEVAQTWRNGQYRQERDKWWWPTALAPQGWCWSWVRSWSHLVKVSAFSWGAPILCAGEGKVPTAGPELGFWGERRRWWWDRQGVVRVTSAGPAAGAPLPLAGLLHTPLPPAPVWVLGGEFSPVCINSRCFFFCILSSPFNAGISAWIKCAFSQLFTALLWNLCSHPSTELSNSLLRLPTVSTLLWPFNQGTWLLSGRHMP